MKGVFLDIDGVLNDSLAPGVNHWNSTLPNCVNNLNFIIDTTGAKVFVISSWVDDVFFTGNSSKLTEFLYARGLRAGSIAGFRKEGLSKENGIIELIKNNETLVSFVIIDDNPTIVTNEFLKTKYLKTQSLVGLTKEDAQKAITILEE